MKRQLSFIAAVCVTSFLGSAAYAGGDKHLDFSASDKDGNDVLTRSEWTAAMEEAEVFDRIDSNNNGVFDIQEADDKLVEYDISMDLDDGGHIERQEFLLGLFNQLDTNGDDRLSKSEYQNFSDRVAQSRLFRS